LAAGATPPRRSPAASSGRAPIPRRRGFTLDLGLGASFMSVDSDRLDRAKLGLAPLSFGIGGFFSRRFALTFRGTGTSLFIDRGNGTEQVVLAYYGPSLQYYAA